MKSDQRSVLLLLLSWFLLLLISNRSGYAEGFVGDTITPSVSIGTCSPLIQGRPFSVCCKTSFLGNASVSMYTPYGVLYTAGVDNGLTLSMKCQAKTVIGEITILCDKTDLESLHRVIFPTFDTARHLGEWRCKCDAYSSVMNLNLNDVVTKDEGMVLGEEGYSANFKWNVTTSSLTSVFWVMNPANDVILTVASGMPYSQSNRVEFIGNIMEGKMWMRLHNVTRSDAGMYVCLSNPGVRVALSVVVRVKPTKPQIIYRNLPSDESREKPSATLYCWSQSQSKGPMMYEKRVTYTWDSLSNSYDAGSEMDGNRVDAWNIDWSRLTSYSLSCRAEQYGLVSESTWIAPQGLYPESGSIVSEDTHNVCNTATTFPVGNPSFWISAFLNALFLLYFLWHLSRIIRSGSCRERCHRLCSSRCCQVAQGGCKSGFVSFRGCFSSMVSCLRFRRRHTWERMEEENANVPDIAVAVQDGEPVHAACPQNADLQAVVPPQQIPDQDLASWPQNADQQAVVLTGQFQDQGTSNFPAYILEGDATGVPWTSAPRTEAEMLMHYEVEVSPDLNTLHGMLKYPPHMLRVRREDLVNDVLNIFKDPSVGEKLVTTRLIDEDGVDLGGVTRDMLTSFWSKARETYFPGNEAFIPYLGLASRSKQRDFITLGRIFSHSTATLKSLPIQICRSTLMVMIYDTCDINPDTLLEDFLLYVDGEYRELIRCSLSNFVDLGEDDKSRLRTFFSKYGMGINPSAATIREHLINLAQNELCIKTKLFCENMRMGIPHTHMDQFWCNITLQNLEHLYKGFRVTPTNVWSKIRCEIWPLQNPYERRVFGYLRDLIQDLHGENLLSFLQFVTGERKIPASGIIVGFNDTRGLARRPIASTCVCRLCIPVSYSSFDEFKAEFMMVLNSDEARTFNTH